MLLVLDFWIILIAFGILFFVAKNDEDDATAIISTIILVIALVLWYWLGDINFWAWIKENPTQVFIALPIYFVIGIAWSIGKWYMLLRKEHEEMIENWKEAKGRWDSWDKYVKEQRPEAKDHKGSIIYWISYWPISMLWALLADAFQAIGRFIYKWVGNFYEQISLKMFSGKEPE